MIARNLEGVFFLFEDFLFITKRKKESTGVVYTIFLYESVKWAWICQNDKLF